MDAELTLFCCRWTWLVAQQKPYHLITAIKWEDLHGYLLFCADSINQNYLMVGFLRSIYGQSTTTVSIKATKGNVNDTTRRRSALSIVIVVAVAPLKLFTYSLRGINYCSFLLHNFHFPNLSPSAFNIVVLFCYPAASPLVFTGRWVKVNRTAWMLPLACHQHTQPPDVTCNSHLTTK